MKKYVIFFYSIALTSLSLFSQIEQEEIEKKQADDPLNKKGLQVVEPPQFTFAPYNDNRHNIHINNHDAEYPCVAQFGEALLTCMICLSKEDLKKNFIKLNVRAARFYLMNSGIIMYKEFLSNFTEEEWHEYHRQLKPEDQKIMPATLKEQYDLIAQSYKEAADLSSAPSQWWYGMPLEYGTEKWWQQVKKYNAFHPPQEKAIAETHRKLKFVMFKLTS